MSEGRQQLQEAIEGWESRYAAAVVTQHDADIVLPFLRAAVEELDAFRKNGKSKERVAPVAEVLRPSRPEFVAVAPDPVSSTPEPVDIIKTSSTPFRVADDDEAVNGLAAAIRNDEGSGQSDDSISSAFGRKSIASLIQEAENEEAAN